MKTASALTAFLLAASSTTTGAFTTPLATRSLSLTQKSNSALSPVFQTKEETESVFVPPEAADEDDDDDDDVLDTVEKFGKGAAKVGMHYFITNTHPTLDKFHIYFISPK